MPRKHRHDYGGPSRFDWTDWANGTVRITVTYRPRCECGEMKPAADVVRDSMGPKWWARIDPSWITLDEVDWWTPEPDPVRLYAN